LVAWERDHGSVLRGVAYTRRQRRAEAAARGQPAPVPARMWSFRQGLGFLVQTLRERLRRPPLTGIAVRQVKRRPEGPSPRWQVRGDGKDCWDADAVVLTCPAYRQAALLADEDPALAEAVGGIAYNQVAVVALGYRADDVPRPLDGFGYLSPQRGGRDVLGVQWCSSIFPDRAPPGMVLMRALCGGWHRPEVVGWHDDRLLAAVRAELAQALGVRAPPLFHHLVRWDRAIPQYHLGHLDRVAWIEGRTADRHPGLYLGGNAYHGVALNDCAEQATVLTAQVVGWLGGSVVGW
jgi:oxygen-dependent protoporphyrinogen oxidase